MNDSLGFETVELQQAFDALCKNKAVCHEVMNEAIKSWQQAETIPDADTGEMYRRYQIADCNLGSYLQMEIHECEEIDEMALQEIAQRFLYRLRPYVLERKYDFPIDDDKTNELFDKLLANAFDPDNPPDVFPDPVRFRDGRLA